MENQKKNIYNKINNVEKSLSKIIFSNKKNNKINNKINNQKNNINKQAIEPNIISINETPSYQSVSFYDIVKYILLFVLILLFIYFIYKAYGYVYENIYKKIPTGNVEKEEEEKDDKVNMKVPKCKSGCSKGKCVKSSSNECKSDSDCQLCMDNQGGFYGTVPERSTDDLKKIKAYEEEDEIQENRIRELEKMILERNRQIQDLNKYIDSVNQNRNKPVEKPKEKEISQEESS